MFICYLLCLLREVKGVKLAVASPIVLLKGACLYCAPLTNSPLPGRTRQVVLRERQSPSYKQHCIEFQPLIVIVTNPYQNDSPLITLVVKAC